MKFYYAEIRNQCLEERFLWFFRGSSMEIKCPKSSATFSDKEELVEHAKVHASEAADKVKSGFKM